MKGFVAVRINGPKEAAAETHRFGIDGYPTALVVDASGDEIDRIVGYRPLDAYRAEIARIAKGEGTLPDLRKKADASPDDVDAGLAYAARIATSKPDEAVTRFDALATKAKDKDRATQAKVLLERGAALLAARKVDDAVKAGETLVQEYADTPSAPQAASRLGRAFLTADARRALTFLDAARGLAKEPEERRLVEELTVQVHRNGAAAALRRAAAAAGDDPMALNEVAWSCFEQRLNVREATGWARRAAEGSKRDPMVLDTLANLLFVQGAHTEALAIEAEAVEKAQGALKTELGVTLARLRAEHDAMEAAKAAAKPAPAPDTKPAEGGAR